MSQLYDKYQRLKFDRPHPNVLRITIAGPSKLNLMDPELHAELGDIWRDVDSDKTVSAALITGAGNQFSAGGDIKRSSGTPDFADRVRTMKEARNIVYNMINCSKPIVSSIRGWAVGGGLGCALLADISIAAKDANLLDGHTKLGVAAGDHAAIIWPLLCGMAKSKYYLLLSEKISGEEAERIGLVSLAVDDAELDAKSVEIAIRLATGAPSAIRWTKLALNNWLKQAGPIFDASLGLEFLGFFGPDVQEGRAAVLEKRAANFRQDVDL
ncbi:MAG: enoyl-CoA hydratase/isomerase family protein [Pseudomonadota bacterium]